MILLISSGPGTMRGLDPQYFGALQVPNCVCPEINIGRVWAADNGAFSGFNRQKFMSMLGLLYGMQGCKFIACPDKLYNHVDTLELFESWAPVIRSAGFPVALIAQDGLTVEQVPWSEIDCIFIGGTTEFKLSAEVLTILDTAASKGIWRHVGRVNTEKRVKHFFGKADSIDGSSFSRWPKNRQLFPTWIERCRQNLAQTI